MDKCTNIRDDYSENVTYDNTEYPAYIRYCFLSSLSNYAFSLHWHDDVEFIIIQSGSMSYNVNGKIINLDAGEGIFVNARQMHFGFSKSRKECEYICVLLAPMMLCLTPDMERNYVLPILQNAGIPFIHLTGANWHQDIIREIHNIYSYKNTPAAALKIQGAFSWIWTSLYENTPQADEKKETRGNDLSALKNMILFIQQHYREKISLDQIAASGSVGQSKCCRMFRTYIHQTPNAYLNGYRLNKSAQLLKATDLNITEIAYEAGFCGASYYAETFRKCFGMSPSEYRQDINASNQRNPSVI